MVLPDDLDLAGEAAMHAVVAEQVRIGLDAAEVVDRDGTTSLRPLSIIARSTRRPMRPNPLMATFTAMVVIPSLCSFSCLSRAASSPPRRRPPA